MMKLTVLVPSEYDLHELDFGFWVGEVNYLMIDIQRYQAEIKRIPADHVIVNLCDGSPGSMVPGLEVVQLLEHDHRLFVGSSARNFVWTKSRIRDYAVSCPPSIVVQRQTIDLLDQPLTLSFPVLVKPDTCTGGSEGINWWSKVDNVSTLKEISTRSLAIYPQVIIEQFITGREFTVMVLESPTSLPVVLEPLECHFPSGETFKHYDLKWYQYHNLSYQPITEPALQQRLMLFAQETFTQLKLDGYIRFDVRMDLGGTLYLLDVNPYPAIFYPRDLYGGADAILAQSRIMNHEQFLRYLIQLAAHRYDEVIMTQ